MELMSRAGGGVMGRGGMHRFIYLYGHDSGREM